MTIPLADGQAIHGDLVAVLDEAAPEVGPGIYYVVTTAIIMDPSSLRDDLDEVLSDRLAHEEIDHLMIENGDRSSNRRDQITLLDHYRTRGGVPFTYDWRSKQERLLWIADAISGVVADDFRTNNDEQILQRLIDNGVLAEPPEYLA